MAKQKNAGPTGKELAILGILWEKGPSTVHDVHAALHRRGETGYTTTLKLMQIMREKGLVDAKVEDAGISTGLRNRRKRRRIRWSRICWARPLPGLPKNWSCARYL